MSAALRAAAEARLAQLRQDVQTGNAQLAQLDSRRVALTNMLLRIEGAVQVLEEILAPSEAAPVDGAVLQAQCQET